MTDKLELGSFRRAIKSLDAALERPKDDFLRDAVIQRFEYTFELAWKMMLRHLKWTGTSDTETLTKKGLFREAGRIGLIRDVVLWFDFNLARNKTSHTYEEATAEEVYNAAKRFSMEARHLLEQLAKDHD